MKKSKHVIRRAILMFGSIVVGYIISKLICNLMVKNSFVIDSENLLNIVTVMIGVWATLLGFIITAESILVAFNNGTITSDFKQTGHYMTVIFQYTQTSVKLLTYIVLFVGISILKSFTMREMFIFILCISMTFLDVMICFFILLLMLRMANR